MSATFDVAVIGAGVTGVAAALAAQRRGARTCLIRSAPGTTALCSGAWAGPLPAELRTALAEAGIPLEKTERPLLHERGRKVSCDFAAASHVHATAQPDAVVCGIFGYPQFHAPALARVWSPAAPLRAVTIQLPGTPAGGWTTVSLAAAIERNTDAFIAELPDAPLLLLPAVLGAEQHAAVHERLRSAGLRVAEVLAGTPSLPGWRLRLALEQVISAHNITVFDGRARVAETERGRVLSVRIANETIQSSSFVLATGKFAGGGITADTELREIVFDLPVWVEQLGDVYTAVDALPLTDPVRHDSQPLLGAGVHTDATLRPVDRAGDVVYQNVFAAGSVRAGWHAALAGLGHCAQDGWIAGSAIT